MERCTALFIFVVALLSGAGAVTSPTGCGYSDGLFTCDYRYALPLAATAFTPQPQRLKITEVNGNVDSTKFTSFSSLTASTFDPNYASSIEFVCVAGGTGILTLTTDAFTGMSAYNEVFFTDCGFASVPANSFANFGSVNYILFRNGDLENIDADALSGLNIYKDTSAPTPRGEFAIIGSKLVAGGLPNGFFSSQVNLTAVTVQNARLRVIQTSLFSSLSLLASINLDYNTFTYITENIFAGLESLTEVSMRGASWECTCNNLWFLSHLADSDVDFTGGAVCALPTSHTNKRAQLYFSDTCTDSDKCPPNGPMPSISLGGMCVDAFALTMYILGSIGFGIGLVALGLVIHTKRQIGGATAGKPGAGGAAGGKGKANWTKAGGGGGGGKGGKGGKGTPRAKAGWS